MVGEFPELQGLMGRYYALAPAQKEEPVVAEAIEEHYKPQGPNDRIPTAPASIAVALADKLDTLVGFWAIDEKPTGSKDPYALRRAALGVIRIVLENGLRLRLVDLLRYALLEHQLVFASSSRKIGGLYRQSLTMAIGDTMLAESQHEREDSPIEGQEADRKLEDFKDYHVYRIVAGLLNFFADRLKVYLRDKGARHDLIDAVFALPGQDDLLLIVRRVEALGKLLDTEDGKNLLAGYRRAAEHPARRGKKGRRRRVREQA